jgi:sortase A
MAVGRVVLVVGILVLLFIPYLLWGTGLMTAHSQDVLRQQFSADQHRTGARPTAPKPATGVAAVPVTAPTIADPAPGSAVGLIVIPKIGLSMVVVEGTDTAELQQGPGHYPGTPLPGQQGNSAIAGHRTTYLHPFYNLDQLVPGDVITVTTLQGVFEYHMTSSEVVDPTDVAVVDNTTTPQLTLTTCNPRFSARQRLVVHAALVASSLTHPTTKPVVVTAKPKSHEAHETLATESTGSWPAAIIWGVVVAAIAILAWMATTRTKGGRRALVLIVGILAWLVVVFFFFEAVGPLLGSSF